MSEIRLVSQSMEMWDDDFSFSVESQKHVSFEHQGSGRLRLS